jgi:hypothetical protein
MAATRARMNLMMVMSELEMVECVGGTFVRRSGYLTHGASTYMIAVDTLGKAVVVLAVSLEAVRYQYCVVSKHYSGLR